MGRDEVVDIILWILIVLLLSDLARSIWNIAKMFL